MQAYVIWSFEHEAWWRPARCGYTEDLAEAGHYSQAEAQDIVGNANRYILAPNEMAVRFADAQSGCPRGLMIRPRS